MAIINRATTNKSTSSDQEETVNTDKNTSVDNEGNNQKKGNAALLNVSAGIIGILIPVIIYLSFPIDSGGSDNNQEVNKTIDFSLEIKQLNKVGSLYLLSKDEFEMAFTSLQEAKNNESSAEVISALEIILDKKTKDIAKYRDQLIAMLFELNQIFPSNSDLIRSEIKKSIQKFEERGSSETVRLLESALKALENAPKGNQDIALYLNKAIDESL